MGGKNQAISAITCCFPDVHLQDAGTGTQDVGVLTPTLSNVLILPQQDF